jgi:hypothetical protein
MHQPLLSAAAADVMQTVHNSPFTPQYAAAILQHMQQQQMRGEQAAPPQMTWPPDTPHAGTNGHAAVPIGEDDTVWVMR